MLPTQLGFFQDKVLADTRRKLAELYFKNPQIANSEKRTILEYWQTYDSLTQVLGDKLIPFISWFQHATSPETITRCLRALKEDGTIKLSPKAKERRKARERAWRSYWAQTKQSEGSDDSI